MIELNTDYYDVNHFCFSIPLYFLIDELYFACLAPPAPPTGLAAKDTESDSVTVSWEPPKHFKIERYHVQILHTSNNIIWRNVTVPGEKTSVTLGDLEADTIYNLTMYSENIYGVGQRKSNALQVQTMKGNAL